MDKAKKKILYFMPDDPIGDKAGNTTRCAQLLAYFQNNSERLEVDFVSLESWKEGSVEEFQRRFPSIRLHILPRRAPKAQDYLNYFFTDKLPKLIRKFVGPSSLIESSTPYIEGCLKNVVGEESYDISLVSYAWWGGLQRVINSNYSIIDTHDFATKQHLVTQNNGTNVGKLFAEELAILGEFDEVWSYSVEEHYIFEQFLNNRVKLMPISFPVRSLPVDRPIQYDVLYVASDNPHNEESMRWFLNEVLPLLRDVTVSVIGKICRLMPDHPLIHKLGVVEDLDAHYLSSKITVCPMISGTGIKIKVLESLAYGLPVVTTRRGVDGLFNKVNNGCLVAFNAAEFAECIHRLLDDSALYQTKSEEGAHLIRTHYSEEMELEMLDSVFLGLNQGETLQVE
ncbi:MAG: glycosyltransferase family 4 protein [Sphingobacteriaceae bacterium]